MDKQVLNLRKVDDYSNLYAVIGSLIDADKAQSVINEYDKSAAEVVFGIGLSIEAKHPDWVPVMVRDRFVEDWTVAIQRHISAGTCTENWEKECKKLNSAFRKVRRTLEYGGKLSDRGSAHACEKWNKQQEELAKAEAIKDKRKTAIADYAEKNNVSVEEAEAIVGKPKEVTNEGGDVAITKEEGSKTTVVKTSGDAEVQPSGHPVLQDSKFSPILTDFLTSLGVQLTEAAELDAGKTSELVSRLKQATNDCLSGLKLLPANDGTAIERALKSA